MQKDENERIKRIYDIRKDNAISKRYSLFNIANLFIVQRREYELIDAIKRQGVISIEDKKILDTGCGIGNELRNFVRYGAKPENLYGVDILLDRIECAKSISPNIEFRCDNASSLPYESEYFDIVVQFTVFTSIIDIHLKESIASEMLRVLKSEGIILWYDFHVDNPKNPDVKGIEKKEIYKLFPDCEIYLDRITLAPPLVRTFAHYSWLLCYFLEKLNILNTHYLGVIRKKNR
jgi:ubiquinone/menaquinone biosynthesis C-methylase UbiE